MFGSVRCFRLRGITASRRAAARTIFSVSGSGTGGFNIVRAEHVPAPWLTTRGFCFHTGRVRQRFSAARDSPATVSDWETQEDQTREDELPVLGPMHQPEARVRVEAVFLARAVDLKSLAAEKSLDATFGRNHLIVKLKDADENVLVRKSEVVKVNETGIPTLDCWNTERFMVVFNYGTAVMFNFGEAEQSEWVERIKQHCRGVFEEATRDNYCVVVKPDLTKWSEGSVDRIMVKELNVNSIRIVAVILSQSIALDHHTKNIDGMLKSFDELNLNMQQTGTFNLKRKELFKLVASVNTALAEAILKVGLLERSDVAWQNADYDGIWAFMREEFELEERFESLEFKTGIIQHNVAFYLEILQNRRSDSLEWIIIVLIAADMCLSLYQIFLR